jgi:hypothetical protein
MKVLRLLALFGLVLTVFACKKEAETEDPNAGSTARFKITGVKDIDLSLSTSGRSSLPVSVVSNAGALSDTVSLQVLGLPSGVRTVIEPATGITTFASRITFINDFSGPGGVFPVKVVGIGNSGSMSYAMNLIVPNYLGWSFNDTVYARQRIVKESGGTSGNPYIYADAYDGSRLLIRFPQNGSIPTKAVTYKIGAAPAEGTLQLQFIRDTTQVFVSTAVGARTASFVFDSLGKFIFKCSDVHMSNGLRSGKLNVSMPE